MDDTGSVKRDILIVAVGELICAGIMLGVYFLIHKLTVMTAVAAAIGVALTALYYFIMALGVFSASKKAEQGDVAGGKRVMSLNMLLRFAILAGVLLGCFFSGFFTKAEMIAMLIPLVLFRPIVSLGEFFRRSGEKKE